MIWAIFSTFLLSISRVFFKKTTLYDIKSELNDLYGHIGAVLGIFLVFFIADINLSLSSNLDYALVLLTFVFSFFIVKINQYVFKNEKISTLVPYENLGKVLLVLGGVFILNDDISLISLLLFLGVIVVIILFSVDLKNLSFSKNIGIFCISQILLTLSNLTLGFILINNEAVQYYTLYVIISLSAMFLICYFLGLLKDTKKLDKNYYINRGVSSLNRLSWIISILLIKQLGLSVTTLLSFLGIAITLITSYIIFKDIPTKKDIFLTIIILTLVGLGYALK